MSSLWKVIMIGSMVLNVIAVWGLFHYIMYGGNPLLEIKRRFVGVATAKSEVNPITESNARIKRELKEGKVDSLRVVFYGASITHSWDLDKYFHDIHPVNRGVGGFVPDMLTKFKSNVLDLKPRAVVIKLCSINIRPQIHQHMLKDGMAMMAQLARSSGIIPIVSTIVPAAKPAAHIAEYSVVDSLRAFNSWVREYAAEESMALIDYASALEDEHGFLPRDCSIDPVHTNEKAYQIMAKVANPVIHKELGLD